MGLNAFQPSVLLNPASPVIGVLGQSGGSRVQPTTTGRESNPISQAQSREAFYAYQRAILTGVSEVISSLRGLGN